MQGLKKQCSSSSGAAFNKKQKPKSGPSNDPQSIAAKVLLLASEVNIGFDCK